MVATQPSVSKYTIYIGQLALDMYDSARKKIVWRAVVSKTIDPPDGVTPTTARENRSSCQDAPRRLSTEQDVIQQASAWSDHCQNLQPGTGGYFEWSGNLNL